MTVHRRTSTALWTALLAAVCTWIVCPECSAQEESVTQGPAVSPFSSGVGFIRNEGQWEARCRYLARAPGMTLVIEEGKLIIHASVQGEDSAEWPAPIRVRFGASDQPATPSGSEPLDAKYNFLLGNDPADWRTGVRAYAQVTYAAAAPGVDLVLMAREGGLSVEARADTPQDLEGLEFRVEGSERTRVATSGALLMDTPAGTLRLQVQPSFRSETSQNETVSPAAFRAAASGGFGLVPGEPNASHSEPPGPGLDWATYLGAFSGDTCRALGLHASGEVTVTGPAAWPSFPTTSGAFDPDHNGGGNPAPSDVFVSRLNAEGTSLVWSTFLGSSGNEDSSALLVGDADSIVVVGSLGSSTPTSDFPVTPGAFQPDYAGGEDIFVAKLSADGADLVFSTFLGGGSTDQVTDVSQGPNGRLVLAGRTRSSDFPTTNGVLQSRLMGVDHDAFVAILEADGSDLIASTLLGGVGSDVALGVAVNSAGRILVGGRTFSADFPTTLGAFAAQSAGSRDAFLACLDPQLQSLVFSTYFGGPDWDEIREVAFDPSGESVVVLGMSGFPGIPTTPGAFDETSQSFKDPFVARFSGDGSQLLMSTFIGGSQFNPPAAMVVESSGAVVIAGQTASSNFPTTTGAYQADDPNLHSAAFVSRLSPEGDRLFYSTYFGSSGTSGDSGVTGKALALDDEGAALIAGGSDGETLPTTPGAFQEHKAPNGSDGFVARLTLLPVGVEAYGASTPGCAGALTIGVTAMPQTGVPFGITCTDAPPASAGGFLVLAGAALATPLPVSGADLWIDLASRHLVLPVSSNALGWCETTLDVPAGVLSAGTVFHAQFVWPDPCVPGRWSASNALRLRVQP